MTTLTMTMTKTVSPTTDDDMAVAVHQFLVSLGSTADEVAESLRGMGIKGMRRNSVDCAIAVALARRFPNFQFSVSGITRIRKMSTSPQLSSSVVMNPEAIIKFVAMFDSGCYPELQSAPLGI